ncbi:shugoshin 2 [Microtus ochrogaster]|uniref:Shugoshin 2 n=1 Tax=Microtus ochrogaster TaxID=79684 RepID=A0ABM0LHS3_MICOH|nr:shugoshin 2 [Microtus ochrogaster]
MEYPVMEAAAITSGIKRRVKDRIAKTKLNVSLASKIKTKILNNSSIFKISLKHNNRALARALSREKENSRRVTTEKMLLQKEVEKLNFENTFLRLKLSNLNKKLIEIESLVNNNLITAIEMSSLSEFHQSPFFLSARKRKRISKQSKSTHLPFARVPLTSENDDDDGDGDEWRTKCYSRIASKTSPDVTSSLSGQSLSLRQCDLEVLLPKEDNQNPCVSSYSERTSSSVDVHPKESRDDSDQSPKSSLSEMKTAPSSCLSREKPSLNNVTERRKRGSSAENLHGTDSGYPQMSSPGFNWDVEINGCASETSSKTQRETQCSPRFPSEAAGDPQTQPTATVRNTHGFQLQESVYENADMDLTASEVNKIIVISKSNKNQRKKKTDCGKEAFRKVKDPSSDKRRERAKRKCKGSSEMGAEGKTENGPEGGSVVLGGRGDSEDPNCIADTEPPQANMLKEITLPSSLDQETIQNKKRKQRRATGEQEETHPFSPSSVRLLQGSEFDQCQNAPHCNRNKPSRQTFVIRNSEKDHLYSNQKDEETSSEKLDVANEFQRADLSTKDSKTVCDFETQTILDLKKLVSVQQIQSKLSNPKPKINRRTKIISSMTQIYEDTDKDVPLQTPASKESTRAADDAADELEAPSLVTGNNGSLHDCQVQNVLDLSKQTTSVHPARIESHVSRIPRHKVNRKTEVISRVNNFSNDGGGHCSEMDESFLPQKDKDIPRTLKDFSKFEVPAICNKDSAKLYEHKTHTLPGMRAHDHEMPPASHKDAKEDKKPRQKALRKTEIISKTNQMHENDEGSVHDPLNKKVCQKVNKSEIVSQMSQLHENTNAGVNGFKSCVKDQVVTSSYPAGITSDKEGNDEPIPDPCVLVKKQRDFAGRAENILTGGKSERTSQLPGFSQQSVALESGSPQGWNGTDAGPGEPDAGPGEPDAGPGEPTNPPKSQEESAVLALGDAGSLGVAKGGSCPAKRGDRVTSKSKKRKRPLALPSDTHGAVEMTVSTDHTKSGDSQQADKENYLEDGKIAKNKLDFCPKALKPLSQMRSSNMKNSSFDDMWESSLPLTTTSCKTLLMEGSSFLESASIFAAGGPAPDKTKERTQKSCHRPQKSGIGRGIFPELVDTSSVSSNPANPKNGSEEQAAEQTRRKRQCAPLNLREPNLVSKMRR